MDPRRGFLVVAGDTHGVKLTGIQARSIVGLAIIKSYGKRATCFQKAKSINSQMRDDVELSPGLSEFQSEIF
jgi:hypothetical protein